jgi:predicted kinase
MTIICPDNYLYQGDRYVWSPQRVKWAWDRAREDCARALLERPREVVLLMGAPGSGKSTWVAREAREDSLYFDAVFDLSWKRKPFIRAAREAGIPVRIVWIKTPLETCLQRNAARSEDRRVPEEILRKMWENTMAHPPDPRGDSCPVEVVG